MARYYAQITGSASITTNFNPNTVWSNNNYLKLEYNGDITTSNGGICPWFAGQNPWFCLVQDNLTQYDKKQYLNIGSSTYIGTGYSWNTEGFSYTTVITFDNRNISMVKGEQSYSGTFSGNIPSNNLGFFTNYANNLQMDFYELKVYGYGNELLFDFVPDYSGTTKGIRDKVSNGFTAATNQNLISLVALSTFYVDTTEITADSSGTSTSVTVTADSDLTWTASTSDSWLSITNPTGSGNGSFTVVVSNNKTHSSKTGTVSVTSSGGDVITISVSQERMPLLVSQKPLYRSGESVIKMYRTGELIYCKVNPHTTPPGPEETPLTFKVISAGTIVWKAQNTAYTTTIQYSKDSGSTWSSITSSTAGTQISVVTGDIIQFKGDNATYSSGSSRYNTFSGSTAIFEVEGNIMSLIDSTGFTTATTLASSYTFYDLFSYCAGLTSAENLVLPATTLANYCYNSMFYYCTSLTTAPELPAPTLANSCYGGMFWGCTNLNYIKCLATDISASYCTGSWLNNVASSGTFVTPSSTNWGTGVSGIPSGWTRVNA